MIDQNKGRILEIYRLSAERLTRQMNRYADSARALRREYNVLDADKQTEVLLEQILKAEAGLAGEQARLEQLKQQYSESDTAIINSRTRLASFRQQLRTLVDRSSGSPVNLEQFREGLDRLRVLEELYVSLSYDLKNNQEKIDYLEMMGDMSYSTLLVVEAARPADKKARPVRWVILLATVLISTLVGIFGLLLIDRLAPLLRSEVATEQAD
jgi:capsule polysaccharide export protein KpsE/RkpR